MLIKYPDIDVREKFLGDEGEMDQYIRSKGVKVNIFR